MRRRALRLALCATAAACGEGSPIPAEDLLVRVTAGTGEVELGKAFPLTVVRVWSRELVPGPWSERALAPLSVRLEETTRREDGRRVEETQRFRCWAFGPDDVALPPLSFEARPRDGGAPRTASAEPLVLRVRRALDRKAPGPPELPGDLLPEPFPWAIAVATALAALAATLILLRRRRSAATPPAPGEVRPVPPPVSPESLALQRLEHLRGRRAETPGEIAAWHVEASALLRAYVAERFGVGAREMTTEEILAAPPIAHDLADGRRGLVAACLVSCDLVKFARHAAGPHERERLVADAAAFLEAVRDGGAAA